MTARPEDKKQAVKSDLPAPVIIPLRQLAEDVVADEDDEEKVYTEVASLDLRPLILQDFASEIQANEKLRAGDEEAWAKAFVKLARTLIHLPFYPAISLEDLSEVMGFSLAQMAAPRPDKDRRWLERFANITLGCTQTLRDYAARADAYALRDIARTLPEWPVCLRDSKESAITARKLVQALGVGTADPFDWIKVRGEFSKPIYEWLRALRAGNDDNLREKLGWPPPDPAKKIVMFYVRKYVKDHPCPEDMTPGVYSQRIEDALDSIFKQYDRLRNDAKELQETQP